MSFCYFRLLATLVLPACVVLPAHAVPFRIQTVQNLSFGSFAANSGGSVTVATNGARSRTGTVALLSSGPGQAAIFLVTGNNNTVYTVSLPAQATLSKSGASMTIVDFTSSPTDAYADAGLLSGGSQYLYVGATLSVPASQSSGNYSGSFRVIVDNN